MEFSATLDHKGTPGLVTYSQEELSFSTLHCRNLFCSLTFGDMYLSLDVAEDCKTVCSVSGFCSPCLWERCSLTIPDAELGTLKCLGNDLSIGCGYKIHGNWGVYYDPSSLSLMIAQKTHDNSQGDKRSYVRFIDNAIAVLAGTKLIAVYIERVGISNAKS